jgi:hypothetical protein
MTFCRIFNLHFFEDLEIYFLFEITKAHVIVAIRAQCASTIFNFDLNCIYGVVVALSKIIKSIVTTI